MNVAGKQNLYSHSDLFILELLVVLQLFLFYLLHILSKF